MIEKIEINLIPAEYITQERHFSADPATVISLIVSIVLSLAALIWSSFLSSGISRENEKIANIEREIEANKTIQTEIKTLETKQSEMRAKVNGLKSVNINRTKWVDAFELYASVLPENTWLTSIEEAEDETSVNVNGVTEADAEVGQIMSRLASSPLVSGVVLVEMKDAGNNGQLKNFSIKNSLVNNNGKTQGQ
ncbi:MAG: PilN domain-containing protein [Chitinispirillales bacterium]|jgi:Tfp pilus assembly protein PilN|nr:PilN domain-containing protein [Chitinispirillales bacterium]